MILINLDLLFDESIMFLSFHDKKLSDFSWKQFLAAVGIFLFTIVLLLSGAHFHEDGQLHEECLICQVQGHNLNAQNDLTSLSPTDNWLFFVVLVFSVAFPCRTSWTLPPRGPPFS